MTHVNEVLDCLERRIAVHAAALSALAKLSLLPRDDELSELFETLAVSANEVLTLLEFWREQLDQQDGAELAGHVPHPAGGTQAEGLESSEQ